MQSRGTGRERARQRGSAVILAMMFLMIFGSLAAAMAIVSQANLAIADSQIKATRARAATETGMTYVLYRLDKIASQIRTRYGIIDDARAQDLWHIDVAPALCLAVTGENHNIREPAFDPQTGVLTIGPISLGDSDPWFTATFTPHPIPGEDYGSSYYQRQPYNEMVPAISASTPLDATWIRLRIEAFDGPTDSEGNPTDATIGRSIQIDLKMDKKIRFAVLSKSRVMVGSHVMIEGPIGSRFTETWIDNGHPIQMVSDFAGLDPTLDAALASFRNALNLLDYNGDNRLSINNSAEVGDIDDPGQYDHDNNGYIDEFDYFLAVMDTNGDGIVTAFELDVASDVRRQQLLTLIDTFGDPTRDGYDDGQIDAHDNYAKLRGEIQLTAGFDSWNQGAAQGMIQDHYQGSVQPSFGESPLTFEATGMDIHQYGPQDFDVSSLRDRATGDLYAQAMTQASQTDPDDPGSPQPLGQEACEAVPYGAAHPYDYYERPVFENMTFTDVRIPKGTNALFKNCTFIGCTFVETETANTDANYNYSGMTVADGTQKHPDRITNVEGQSVDDTKSISANIRFDGCTFEGAVATDSPSEYTHVRNKLAFTGTTRFEIEGSTNLTDEEKVLYTRSAILAPHFSVEMGTFIDPTNSSETVELTGTIVAGVLDLRGQVNVTGTILTTFEPQSDVGPVIGETSPQFNTTLGYFSSEAGDLEAEMPETGLGVIHVRYDSTIPLPDGILGPIEIRPVLTTYFEGGAQP